jgi:anti-sigma B factor antagonist
LYRRSTLSQIKQFVVPAEFVGIQGRRESCGTVTSSAYHIRPPTLNWQPGEGMLRAHISSHRKSIDAEDLGLMSQRVIPMPDDDDFTINDQQHVFDETPSTFDDEITAGDSGVLVTQPADPNLLRITRDGGTLTVGFARADIPDEVSIASYRDQVLHTLDEHPDCRRLTFDVTQIRMLPSGMLGLLATVKKRGREVEILNPSKDVQEALRVTRLITLFKVRHAKS